MMLEAISPSCWSDLYVVKLDGRPWGEFHARWYSENIGIRLMGRRQFSLEKVGWLGNRFTLADIGDGRLLAEADRGSLFTSDWELRLSIGSARLVSAGWFNAGYRVIQSGRELAAVNQIGLCSGGWAVEDEGSLKETDLLFIGLIYHTIVRRNASAAAAT
jgi:hypothetical protein